MEAYILSKKTFKTIAYYAIANYTLYLGTASDAHGQVNIPAEVNDYAGNWLKIGKNIWYIETSSPSNGQTVLKTADPVNFFNRTLFFEEGEYVHAGDLISEAIEEQFINCSDVAYQFPYITVTDNSTTGYFEPELDDATYNLGVYIKTAINAGLKVDFSYTSEGKLEIKLSNAARNSHTVFLNNGISQLESSAFSSGTYAKVTVRRPIPIESENDEEETEYEYEDTDFYYDTEGNISESVPENRPDGKWEIIVCTEDDVPLEVAKELFDDNAFSYKISFWSFNRYELFDSVLLMLPSGRFRAIISEIRKSSDDDRYYYQCGQKTTTLTETVRAVTDTISGEALAGENKTALAAYPVGSIYMSVNDVSPASLFGGTWKQIQSRFLIGASSEYPIGTTGGEKEHILTIAEMPAHTHTGVNVTGGTESTRGITNAGGRTTGSTGEGKAHNNLPPYLAVFIWERIG